MSPRDPIFWMHHANVDRIWTSWMRAQQAANLPIMPPDTAAFDTKATWLDFSLKDGFMEPVVVNGIHELKPTDKAFLISETLDSVTMSGYDYDVMATLPVVGGALLALDDSSSRQPITVPAPYRAAFDIEMAIKLKQVSVLSTSNAVVFTLDINGSKGITSDGEEMGGAELLKRAQEAISSAQSSGSKGKQPSMVLYADNVPIPKEPKTTFLEFYFNKTPQKKPVRVPADYLGSFSYFGTDHVHHGHHAATTTGVVFDIVKSISETDPRINQAGNLFVTMFVNYRNESGQDIKKDMPNDLKENLKKMTLRIEYTEN
jgi:tyrosinase